MYKVILQDLQTRRQHLGMSSQEVSEKIGVSDSLVSLWECGKKQPSMINFINWCSVLGFNLILNVHQQQIPKSFVPSYDTKQWIISEFGERYNYDNELKIFINHYRAGGTVKSDWQYAFRSWLLRSKKFTTNTTQTSEGTKKRRERINNVFAISNQTKQNR
jgi:transcriptional regulator with XRE-family HTH domain